ncbi:MAG: hypothetical protein RIR00_824 [Pseudomonadota bacterium]|jgi:hypothetical protein
MSHWSEPYIGRAYVRGESDCAHLVCDVSKTQFGVHVPDADEVARRASRLGRTAQLVDGLREYCTQVNAPAEGDVVQIVCLGRPGHVGIYCVVSGEDCVLHAIEKSGVVLTRIRDFPRLFMRLEGYYRWK